jgi:hypothetical protein
LDPVAAPLSRQQGASRHSTVPRGVVTETRRPARGVPLGVPDANGKRDDRPRAFAARPVYSASEYASRHVVLPDLAVFHVAERGLDLGVTGLPHHVAQIAPAGRPHRSAALAQRVAGEAGRIEPARRAALFRGLGCITATGGLLKAPNLQIDNVFANSPLQRWPISILRLKGLDVRGGNRCGPTPAAPNVLWGRVCGPKPDLGRPPTNFRVISGVRRVDEASRGEEYLPRLSLACRNDRKSPESLGSGRVARRGGVDLFGH